MEVAAHRGDACSTELLAFIPYRSYRDLISRLFPTLLPLKAHICQQTMLRGHRSMSCSQSYRISDVPPQHKHLLCHPQLGLETSSACSALAPSPPGAHTAVTPKHPTRSTSFCSTISVRFFQLSQVLSTQMSLCTGKESISRGNKTLSNSLSPAPCLLETAPWQPHRPSPVEPSHSTTKLFRASLLPV